MIRVELPPILYKDGITAQLGDEATEMAADLAIAFTDCRTSTARADRADTWLRRVVARDGGSGLPDASGVLTAMIEARRDDVVTSADHAGLLMGSLHEEWRMAGRDWFQRAGLATLETWLDRRQGVCALILMFIQANIAAGVPVPAEAE